MLVPVEEVRKLAEGILLANGVPHQAVPMLAEDDVVLAATAGAIRDGTRVKLAGAPAAGTN